MDNNMLSQTLKAIAENAEQLKKLIPIQDSQKKLSHIPQLLSENSHSLNINFYISYSLVIPIHTED